MRFGCKVHELVFGHPKEAAQGLNYFLGVRDEVLYDGLRRGVGAIVDEIHMHGTDVDRECLDYCLNQRAGSSALVFSNSPYPRDCDEHGVRPE